MSETEKPREETELTARSWRRRAARSCPTARRCR